MRTIEVCEAFVNGVSKGQGNSIFIEGNVIYSYGRHFPMGVRLVDKGGFKFILTNSKYSATTSKHQHYLRDCVGGDIINEVSVYRLQAIISKNITSVKELIINNLGGYWRN